MAKFRIVVAAELVEMLLENPEIYGLNPVVGRNFLSTLNSIETTKRKISVKVPSSILKKDYLQMRTVPDFTKSMLKLKQWLWHSW